MRVHNGWRAARALCLVIVLGLVLAVPAFADMLVNNVKVTNQTDRVEVTVSANITPFFNPKVSGRGEYICFAFPGRCTIPGRYVSVGAGGILGVRYGAFSSRPPVTRVVVNTSRHLGYSTNYSSDKRSVTLTVWKKGFAPKPALTPVAKSQPAPVVQQPLKTAVVVEPRPVLARMVEQKGSDSGADPAFAAEPVAAPAPVVVARTAAPPTPVATPAAAPKPAQPVRMAMATGRKSPTAGRRISLDFVAADINDVLKALSLQSGVNVVCGTDVKGSVTVSLNNVGVEEALDYVAKLSGYKYLKDGNTYIVGSAQGVGNIAGGGGSADETCSEAISVRYCNVKGLLDMLGKQFPDLRLSGDSDPEKDKDKVKTGVKLVAFVGPKASVMQAKALAEQVEAAFEKESIGTTVQVYEVRYASPKELCEMLTEVMPQVSVRLAASNGFDAQAPGPVSIDTNQGAMVNQAPAAVATAEERSYQRLVISGSAADVKRAVDILGTTDVKLPQVLIEAKVTDIGLTAEKRLGVQWSWTDIVFSEAHRTEPVPAPPTTGELAGNGKFFRLPVDVTATLDAMFKDGTARLLANPHITTLEGKPAVFFVGDEIKYVINMTTTVNGVTITTETAKVGIQLRAIADVSPEREITLNLHPEVSVISDFIRVTPGGGGTNTLNSGIVLPQIARRFTDQTIRVKDGESIVIGGLIKEKELNNLTKVPLLGDIPFFGGLFRHREKTREKSEIVIFLKATVVE